MSFDEMAQLRREDFVDGRKGRAGLGAAGDHIDGPAQQRNTKTMARGGHGRPAFPTVSRWIVGFNLFVRASCRFAAEDKDFLIEDSRGDAAPNSGERR